MKLYLTLGTCIYRALHESVGNWTESDCWEAKQNGSLWGEQARVCRRQPTAMPHVAAAARLVRSACLSAHAGERWNCSSIELAPKYTPDLLTESFNEVARLSSFVEQSSEKG
ncbi:unnamed protein product [Pieris brassicae]|uniref:Protein Wnt n=1 Tax=Pieris brassicae TaxID=7116 RepID=A0A9P0XIH8_PIEBR|nr:unnamed protein product [Pieris brassicae]